MAKDLHFALLLDIYGSLLTQKQQYYMELYFCEDLSLAEIAEGDGISRQAVRDTLKRGEQQLSDFEGKLGFFERLQHCNAALETLKQALTPEAARLSVKTLDIIHEALSNCEEAVAIYQ